MMAEIWFIRHGESLANAGHVVKETSTVPLTERGHQQAADVSKMFTASPDLIVVTPYLRTRQTAIPTLNRFPAAKREIWPLQEFACLSHANYANTTATQRVPLVRAYWDRQDPDYVDGDGAESFNTMTARIKDALNRLQSAPETFITIFTHGRIMHALRFLIEYPELPAREMMAVMAGYIARNTIENCSVIRAMAGAQGVRLHQEDRKLFLAGFPGIQKDTP